MNGVLLEWISSPPSISCVSAALLTTGGSKSANMKRVSYITFIYYETGECNLPRNIWILQGNWCDSGWYIMQQFLSLSYVSYDNPCWLIKQRVSYNYQWKN